MGITLLYILKPFLRFRLLKLHLLPRNRMDEFQCARMKAQPVERISFRAVVLVTCERIMPVCKMCANLIFLSRIKFKFKKRMGRSALDNNKICSCFHGFCIVIRPVLYIAHMVCILCKGIIDKSTVRQRSMMASGIFRHGMIDSASDHFLPGTHDFFLNVFVEGKHHYTACIPVQTVNDKGSVCRRICTFFAHDFFNHVDGCP